MTEKEVQPNQGKNHLRLAFWVVNNHLSSSSNLSMVIIAIF